MNIYQKIIKVMESIKYLKKDDTVGKGASAYKAISDEKVKKEIRDAMISNGLVMFRTNVETETVSREYEQYNDYKKVAEQKVQHFCKVKSTYKIVNTEKPEESIEIQSIGHGVDPQDKAAGKAMTYASKYALLDTFLVPTGEDADKTHSNDIEQPTNKKKAENKTEIDKKELSDKQINRLMAIAKKAGYTDDDIKQFIKKKYSIDSKKHLSKSQYDEVCERLEKNPKEDKQ